MTARVFVDTNILACAFGSEDDARQHAARAALNSLRTTAHLVVSPQVLGELFVVLTHKLRPPLAPETARAAVELVAQWEVVPHDAELVLVATRRCVVSRISFWDALIVEAALRGGCERLLTGGLHTGGTIDGLRVESPFPG